MPRRDLAILGAGIFAGLLAVPAIAQPAPPTPPAAGFPAANVNVTAQDFVTRAAISDKYEVRSAQLAQQRSHNPRIDAFARQMIADHGKSSAELGALVARHRMLSMPMALDARHRGMIEQLERVSRREFPELYMQQQVQAHEEATALFSSYAGNGDRPRFRRFAGSVLPIIRRHLDMARSLSFAVQHAR